MIKKLGILLLTVVMVASLAACGAQSEDASENADTQKEATESDTEEADDTTDEAATEEGTAEEGTTEEGTAEEGTAEEDITEGGNSIVVYFSWSGNTRTIAEEIQSQTGADIFEVTPVTPYSTDYNTVLDEAQAEQSENARPEINGTIENFEQYDVVYLGYPNWWGDMPMILYSLLDEYDFAGKTIVPFVSSGGSGFSNSLDTIVEMEPDAVLTEGLSLSSSESVNPADAVTEWLAGLNL